MEDGPAQSTRAQNPRPWKVPDKRLNIGCTRSSYRYSRLNMIAGSTVGPAASPLSRFGPEDYVGSVIRSTTRDETNWPRSRPEAFWEKGYVCLLGAPAIGASTDRSNSNS